MADVFISYRNTPERRALVERLAFILHAYRIDVWWDYDLAVGNNYRDQIERELSDASVVAPIWCSESIRSDWVLSEARLGSTKLMPARLQKVVPPKEFESTHAADLIGWDGSASDPRFQDFARRICERLGRSAQLLVHTQRQLAQMPPVPPLPEATSASAPYPRNSEEMWLWLRTRPIEVSRAIAARGALRAIPSAYRTAEDLLAHRRAAGGLAATDQHEFDALRLTELETAEGYLSDLFRSVALAWFVAAGSNHATPEVKTAALTASRLIRDRMLSSDAAVAAPTYAAVLTAYVDSVRDGPPGTSFKSAGRYAAEAAAPHSAAASSSDLATPGRVADLQWFESDRSGPALTASPLWPDGAGPDEWTSRWKRLRAALLDLDPSWSVWTDWYEDRIRGTSFDVETERKRVLVPDEV